MRSSRRIILTGVVAALAIGLSACAAARNSRTGDVALTSALPAAKTAVASVNWNLPYEPAALDPIKTQVWADAPVESNLCESLLKVQPDLGIEPGLASSYKQVDDLTWTYTLRSGVKFWDGTPMTAADVVASLQRNLDPNSGSYWSLEFQNVTSVTADSPTTVSIHLSKPDALVNQVLATSAGAISEAAFLAKAGDGYGSATTGLMCTGPYKLVSWTAGDSIVMERNDGYWKTTTEPKTKRVTFHFVTDPSTITSALTSGELQGMYQVPAASIPALRKSTSGTFSLGASTASLDLIPTERPGPLHETAVRQALFQAIDRAAIARNVYNGAAVPAVSFINPGVGYGRTVYADYLASRPAAKVDLAAAKKQIAASTSAAAPIRIATSPDPSLETVANAIAAAGSKIGLNITVVTLTAAENDQLYFDPKLRDQYDGFLNVQWTLTTDPLEELEFVTPGAFTNYGQYQNPKFLDAFTAALGITDATERAKAAVKAVRIIDADLPWVPIVSLPVSSFVAKGLTGVPTSWAALYGGWAASLGGE